MKKRPSIELTWRHPQPSEMSQVYRMLMAAYRRAAPDFSTDPDFFRRYTESDPRHRGELWLVGELGGEPITALRVFDRDLILAEGVTVRLGGIGNVGTHPDHGGHGYATELLRRAIKMMVAEGFDLSLLYTGVPALYSQLGWKSISLPARRLQLSRPLSDQSVGNYRIEEVRGEECRMVGVLYDRSYAHHPGALARDESYWRRWIGGFALGHYGHRLLVALEGGHPVAYLAGKVLVTPHDERELKVAEGAALPGKSGALVELAHRMGQGVVYISWPEVPWLNRAFAVWDGEVKRYERDGGMVLPLREGWEIPRFGYLLSALDSF